MPTIINVSTSIIQSYLIYKYQEIILIKRKKYIPKGFYVFALALKIFIDTFMTDQMMNFLHINLTVINVSLNMLTFFLLCFFYTTPIYVKIFATLYFQILCNLSADTMSLIVSHLFPDFLNNIDINAFAIMCAGSVLFEFLFILISITIYKYRVSRFSNVSYNIQVFATPVCSIIISLSLPGARYFKSPTVILILFTLLVLNILNYALIEQTFKNNEYILKVSNLETQIKNQEEKYKQINSSYKNSRRMIHDTKKHYMSIQKKISEKDYNSLLKYLDTAVNDLESTYSHFNTGNLILDSFLSNYKIMFDEQKIPFNAVVNVNIDRIPLEDYDLSIILGNLLDNAFNACLDLTLKEAHLDVEIYTDKNDKFIIHTINPYKNHYSDNKEKNLNHGYGLENIERTVAKYNGIFDIDITDNYEVYVVIPIMDIF